MGLLLKVRIDGGPPLRLLLDSGAQSIVLDKRAAARSGHSGSLGFDLDLVGLGTPPRTAAKVVAGMVEIGDLIFHDCPLIVTREKILDGIDGVLPLSLFAGFLIRLDIPGKTLELAPYPARGLTEESGMLPVRDSNDLLFVKAVLNETREGYVLLDTGASYSAVSEETARGLGSSRLSAVSVPLRGGAGATEGWALPSGVRFRLGLRVVDANRVVAVGLTETERYHQLKVVGILGYPALRESVLTVDYRDGLVGIAGK